MRAMGNLWTIPRDVACIGLLLLLLACPVAAADSAALYRLIDARLELMDEVAAYKWRHGLHIEDLEREAVVLDNAVADGLRFGITPDSSRRWFAAQIDAAKAIQRHWFEIWAGGAEPPPAPDLAEEIRPELLRLGSAMLEAAAQGPPVSAADFASVVEVRGLDAISRGRLFEALQGLARYPHRLAQIIDTGVLRVGTTGDYAPFSHRADGDAAFTGIDIDLARHLAGELGVQVAFVATSWPDLMDDLRHGRFDVGMSGISRILARQRNGFLSRPYYVGGKTPIARCRDTGRFDSLAAIDRKGVRVIVNPGGTNEAFVDAHIHNATKILHPDNRTIFDVIVAGEADVMITDRVEVELQSRRRPELCPAMSGTLTYQEKAYLMPQDPVWRAFVDTWLDLALADGTVAGAFREHGVEPRPPGRVANAASAAESNDHGQH